MKTYLADYKNADGIKKTYQNKFYGYNHTLSCEDGEIWDEKNMSSDHFPVMAPRQRRYVETGYYTLPLGYDRTYELMTLAEQIYNPGTPLEHSVIQFVYGASTVIEWANAFGRAQREIAWLNKKAVIMPDKKCFDSEAGTISDLEPIVGPMQAETTDGTYEGQPALGNTLVLPGADLSVFNVGDAVKISGVTLDDITAVIRGKTTVTSNPALVFYENTFSSGTVLYQSVTVKRAVPALDFICQDENRLWGCSNADNTIYASKIGDPTNWEVYDGLSTDSYAIDVGSAGPFTACCSYQGYPTFFKEDHVYKIYGTMPSNYQLSDTMTLGVEPGSAHSLAVAGETLFYKARPGIMAYTGGAPKLVSEVFGEEGRSYFNAVGGSDGMKYYVSVMKPDIEAQQVVPILFVYDTRYGVWHKEDDTKAVALVYKDGWMYCMAETETGSGKQMVLNGEELVAEGGIPPFTGALESSFASFVEFGDFVAEDPNKKGLSKIQFRCSTGSNIPIIFSISYDGGEYETIYQSAPHTQYIDTQGKKRSFYLPLTPHRCDNYRLKITGYHGWRLWTLSRDEYSGSELQKH
ncbi:MAG: hypothetical protein LIQ26_06440 [Bacteroidota bacterium]|nr:hypothetical protein [Bacteroidota bacterium]